ncbi:hypothetical protein L210DRAFT_3406198, partial [Boletus edulis BED1]
LMYVRIIGFLLLHTPNRGVRSEVTKSVHSCKHSSDLADFGAFFERNVIVPHHSRYRGRTPEPSEHPSRPFFEVENDEVKVDITRAPKSHKDAKYHALIRDNWRCIVTGTLDRRVPERIAQFDPTTVAVNTRCAHIFPEATYFGFDYSASVLAVLKRFGYDIGSFNGENVHCLTNVISMEFNVHEAFDRLKLYFEATASFGITAYFLGHDTHRWFSCKPYPNVREYVKFSTSDPENLPIPACELLSLHATCCKVAHLSGATEYIDEIVMQTN